MKEYQYRKTQAKNIYDWEKDIRRRNNECIIDFFTDILKLSFDFRSANTDGRLLNILQAFANKGK